VIIGVRPFNPSDGNVGAVGTALLQPATITAAIQARTAFMAHLTLMCVSQSTMSTRRVHVGQFLTFACAPNVHCDPLKSCQSIADRRWGTLPAFLVGIVWKKRPSSSAFKTDLCNSEQRVVGKENRMKRGERAGENPTLLLIDDFVEQRHRDL
jgi:hypothetical protein